MWIYRTGGGLVGVDGDRACSLPGDVADWIARDDLYQALSRAMVNAPALVGFDLDEADLLAPIDRQEVWAAGVTWYRSRDARMEESAQAGGGSFYDRVYSAERPELFFKASPRRVVGHGGEIRVRADSTWNVPEPELTLVVSAGGKIVGCTIGNDVSSRSIEGENPLYLPQAKVYNQCCALGPGIRVLREPLPATTTIAIAVARAGRVEFEGAITLAGLKRRPQELVDYLFRDSDFQDGVFLMTGTGIVPDRTFTLLAGDEVEIRIEGVGLLRNRVVQGGSSR